MTSMIGYLDIYIGDEKDYSSQSELYKNSEQFFQQVAPRYGLQGSKLADLDEDDKELLQSSSPPFPLLFKPPTPLNRGRLHLSISTSSGLSKTRENFVNLLRGSKGSCKSDKSKKLYYKDTFLHRIETDFVIQGGDVTRNDGSGGEASIGSGVIKAEAEGLGVTPQYGSICMANSGRKDSITSQFFIVIATSATQLKKLGARQYVTFGNVICQENQLVKELDVDQVWKVEGSRILKELEELSTTNGNPKMKAWVGESGVLE